VNKKNRNIPQEMGGGGWVTQEPLARPAVAREGERAEHSTAPESSRKAWTVIPTLTWAERPKHTRCVDRLGRSLNSHPHPCRCRHRRWDHAVRNAATRSDRLTLYTPRAQGPQCHDCPYPA
jgi:hypothetical protein